MLCLKIEFIKDEVHLGKMSKLIILVNDLYNMLFLHAIYLYKILIMFIAEFEDQNIFYRNDLYFSIIIVT